MIKKLFAWPADRAWRSLNIDRIFPGSPEAKMLGCKCSGASKKYNDGTGYDVSPDCYMHRNLPELGE